MSISAFCGVIDEIPGISVDNFENPEEVKARAYFLSHCHSDHTQGLYSEALIEVLERTGACIYMSESTAAVVEDETMHPALMKYVKPLPLGTSPITLPEDWSQGWEEQHIDVALVPAGHSFGSVMFLFRTTKKTILFTGDFRMCPNDLPKYAQFHKGMDPIDIDAIYLDTTFIEHRYLNFPLRSESIKDVLEVIKRHLRQKDSRIALHTSARYGYENLFTEIHKVLNVKVYVGQRWKFYRKILHLVPGVTNDENSTRIHLCRNMSEKKDHSNCLTTHQNHYNFLYIHFSAMKWGNFNVDDSAIDKVSEKRLNVCFATHCCRSELLYFVNYFQPTKVVGFPVQFPREDMKWLNLNNDLKNCKINLPKKRKSMVNGEQKMKLGKKIDKVLLNEIFAD